MIFKFIGCKIFMRETYLLAAHSPHVVDTLWLEQQLHNEPEKLRRTVRQAIDQVEAEKVNYDAILLGYGLCSNGIAGLHTQRTPLVVPRAHDCITVMLGSKERYAQEFHGHDGGIYWYSPGWIKDNMQPGPERYHNTRRQYVEKYGEENADFLMESEQAWFQSYSLGAYVDTGLTDPAGVEQDIAYTKRCTDWLKWNFDRLHGSSALMEALLDGCWNDADFLVLAPGQSARMTADERIVTAITLPNSQKVAV